MEMYYVNAVTGEWRGSDGHSSLRFTHHCLYRVHHFSRSQWRSSDGAKKQKTQMAIKTRVLSLSRSKKGAGGGPQVSTSLILRYVPLTNAIALLSFHVDTAFKQQRLKAWQPILTPKTVLPTLFIVGLLFAPIGGLLLWGSSLVSITVRS